MEIRRIEEISMENRDLCMEIVTYGNRDLRMENEDLRMENGKIYIWKYLRWPLPIVNFQWWGHVDHVRVDEQSFF